MTPMYRDPQYDLADYDPLHAAAPRSEGATIHELLVRSTRGDEDALQALVEACREASVLPLMLGRRA